MGIQLQVSTHLGLLWTTTHARAVASLNLPWSVPLAVTCDERLVILKLEQASQRSLSPSVCLTQPQVRREHEDVRKRRLDEFMAGFNCISLCLKEMYQMITLGGDAELELVDSLDPFSEVHAWAEKSNKPSGQSPYHFVHVSVSVLEDLVHDLSILIQALCSSVQISCSLFGLSAVCKY